LIKDNKVRILYERKLCSKYKMGELVGLASVIEGLEELKRKKSWRPYIAQEIRLGIKE